MSISDSCIVLEKAVGDDQHLALCVCGSIVNELQLQIGSFGLNFVLKASRLLAYVIDSQKVAASNPNDPVLKAKVLIFEVNPDGPNVHIGVGFFEDVVFLG